MALNFDNSALARGRQTTSGRQTYIATKLDQQFLRPNATPATAPQQSDADKTAVTGLVHGVEASRRMHVRRGRQAFIDRK